MTVSSSQGIYNRIKNRKRDRMGSRWISMARVAKYVAVFGRDYLTKARKEIFLQLELVFFFFLFIFPFSSWRGTGTKFTKEADCECKYLTNAGLRIH